MQIVIDIPENKYKLIQEGEYCGLLDKDLYQNIKCGISLDDVKADIIAESDNKNNNLLFNLGLLAALAIINKHLQEVEE